MPTGYTACVQDGSVTEFSEFALICARGMGALILMRDDPMDAPIPERFEPYTEYNDRGLAEAQARLNFLETASAEELEKACEAEYVAEFNRHLDSAADRKNARANYEAMLAKVVAWQPPTPDHAGLKEFMVDQLKQSVDFDCAHVKSFDDRPERPTVDDWKAEAARKARRDIEHHTKARAEEVARTEARNRWIAELRKSLA